MQRQLQKFWAFFTAQTRLFQHGKATLYELVSPDDGPGYKDVEETIKMLPEKPAPILFAKILNQVAGLGRIHAAQPSFSFS